jgi:hypothetical protein
MDIIKSDLKGEREGGGVKREGELEKWKPRKETKKESEK